MPSTALKLSVFWSRMKFGIHVRSIPIWNTRNSVIVMHIVRSSPQNYYLKYRYFGLAIQILTSRYNNPLHTLWSWTGISIKTHIVQKIFTTLPLGVIVMLVQCYLLETSLKYCIATGHALKAELKFKSCSRLVAREFVLLRSALVEVRGAAGVQSSTVCDEPVVAITLSTVGKSNFWAASSGRQEPLADALDNSGHVLYPLLPPEKSIPYPWPHDRIVPRADHLLRKTFLLRNFI